MSRPITQSMLDRSVAQGRTRMARVNLLRLRRLVKSARAERRHAIRAVVEHCRAARLTLRGALRAERVRVREQLRAHVALERENVKAACIAGRKGARDEGDAKIAAARAAYTAAVVAERAHRDATRTPKANKAHRSSEAERRSESDDEVRSNIPAELHHLWEAVKSGIKATAHRSRTESFLHYVEENPGEALERAQDKADAFVKMHERAEREAAAAYKAATREEKKPRRSSAASRTRPLVPAASDRTIQKRPRRARKTKATSAADAFEFGHNAPASSGPSMPAPRHEAEPIGARPSSRPPPPPPRRSSAPPRPYYAGKVPAYDPADPWVKEGEKTARGGSMPAPRHSSAPPPKKTRKARAAKPNVIERLAADVGFLSGANLTTEERQRAIQAENDRNLPASVWRKRQREERERKDAERARARHASEERGDQIVTIAYVDAATGAARAMVYGTAPQDDLIRMAEEAKAWVAGVPAFTRPQVKAWPASRTNRADALRSAVETYHASAPGQRDAERAARDKEHARVDAIRMGGVQEREAERVRARFAARDLAASLRISDARKAEDAADRARRESNPELQAELRRDAARRGKRDDET